ncbi:hypothetical protein LTR91_017685 [Friedmanniomyces endolithicus]|uniref:Uncharacterized protein n=2 Tax=Dothideomycetidae TaxID=451867 RepID=A0A4U0URC6_9PEZI|nr:hypothetical protein LTS09_008891 [Friedmanniomyces endolithicus]KAK5141034.1 hypothetical protein LTR32_006312 [Rachicladosporium monterosium]KAK0793254.1 hypothetical protein LTR38_009606 [Friedmanniomyces endolithicus]KAK0855129.1 hypothetical protein LTS02_011191 [Friedmanniomyces endolithicus]KAK0905891.1 hypothetical protein LTR02_006280 [Friedmanniomyces endolithicus]
MYGNMQPLSLNKTEAVAAVNLEVIYQDKVPPPSPAQCSKQLPAATDNPPNKPVWDCCCYHAPSPHIEATKMHPERNAKTLGRYHDDAKSTTSSNPRRGLFSRLRTSKKNQVRTKEYQEVTRSISDRLARFTNFKGSLARPEKTIASSKRCPALDEKTMAER